MVKSINVKVEEDLYESMTSHEEINWSGVLRSAIRNKLEELNAKKFDKKEAQQAIKNIEKIRKSKIFSGGKTGDEIIREWRQKKILDASIGMKWFSEEENSDKAIKLLMEHGNGTIVLVIPELFYYEITNALRYKRKSAEDLENTFNELDKLQLSVKNVDIELIKKIAKIADNYDLTIYDATYLALAELLNAKLVTADKQIIATKHPLVETLGN